MVSLLIFDMDDTLISSAETWKRAEARVFAALGHDYSPEIAHAYKGMNARDVARTIHRMLQPDGLSADDCEALLRRHLLEGFASEPLRPMPGIEALLQAVAGRFRLCVASGSPLAGIEQVVARMGWQHYFEFLLTSEDVPHGKPAPDIFLAAAARAGVAPAACLVFEDSLPGVRAAHAAGIPCYVVPSSPNPAIAEEADRAFSNWEEAIGLLVGCCAG